MGNNQVTYFFVIDVLLFVWVLAMFFCVDLEFRTLKKEITNLKCKQPEAGAGIPGLGEFNASELLESLHRGRKD